MTISKNQKLALVVLAGCVGVVAFALAGGLVFSIVATALGNWALTLAADYREIISFASWLCMMGSIFAMMFGMRHLISKLLDWRQAHNKPSISQILAAAKEDVHAQRARSKSIQERADIDTQTPSAAADTPRARL